MRLGGPHGRTHHAHGEGGDDGHDDVQGDVLDIDAGGGGALASGEGERLQEDRRGSHLGGDRGDVARGRHEAAVRVVEGGVAGADGASCARDTVLACGEHHAGVRLCRRLPVVADADGEAFAPLPGADTERVEQSRQRRRHARLRAHQYGQGQGFERHGALR